MRVDRVTFDSSSSLVLSVGYSFFTKSCKLLGRKSIPSTIGRLGMFQSGSANSSTGRRSADRALDRSDPVTGGVRGSTEKAWLTHGTG